MVFSDNRREIVVLGKFVYKQKVFFMLRNNISMHYNDNLSLQKKILEDYPNKGSFSENFEIFYY